MPPDPAEPRAVLTPDQEIAEATADVSRFIYAEVERRLMEYVTALGRNPEMLMKMALTEKKRADGLTARLAAAEAVVEKARRLVAPVLLLDHAMTEGKVALAQGIAAGLDDALAAYDALAGQRERGK